MEDPFGQPQPYPRRVRVSGSGEVAKPPDVAWLRLGVQELGPDLDEVKRSVAGKSQAIRQALRDAGVSDADVQTRGLNVRPEYDHKSKQRKLIGYWVIYRLTIRVRQVDRAGELVELATAAGSNLIEGLEFDLDDRQAAMREARTLAVAGAREKAEQLAELTSATLGAVITVEETSYDPRRAKGGAMRALAASASFDSAPTLEADPGEITVTSEVNVSWELR